MTTVNMFFAYQFASSRISKADRELYVARSVQSLSTELSRTGEKFSVSWSACDLQSNHSVFEQISTSIENCSIFIADISEINPNVMFELGMAFAFARIAKRQIAIICHESVDTRSLPSDILGLYIESYSTEYFQQIFAGQLTRCVRAQIAQQKHDDDLLVGRAGMFGFGPGSTLDIVCSELPDSDLPYFAKPSDHNYLRYACFADLDSFIHIKSHVLRLFPSLRIRDFTASEHKSADYDSLFVLGGPAWNQRFRIFQDQLPFTFIERSDDEDDLFQFKPGYEIATNPIGPKTGIGGRIAKDVSVICKLTDATGRKVFLFAGCLTLGVLGACKALLCKGVGARNADYLHTLVGLNDFVAVFLSDYLEHEVIAPLFDQTEFFALLQRQPRSGEAFALCKHSGLLCSDDAQHCASGDAAQ